MSEKTIIFRLTEGRTPASWSLKGGMAVKNGEGLKYIGYYKGSNSIFVDDNTDDRPQQEVIFEYNDTLTDPATEIQVPVSDKNLIDYLKAHAFFNIHYKIHNLDALAEEKLLSFDATEKALAYIKEESDLKTQAIALAVFKSSASGWSVVRCKAELKEAAIKNPKKINDAFEDQNYESNFLAALAFYSNVVTENNTHTAVVWCDADQGEILRLAVGENGITKLGELLSKESDQSIALLQQIALKIEVKEEKTKPAVKTDGKPVKTEEEIRAEVRAEERAKIVAEMAADAKKHSDQTGTKILDKEEQEEALGNNENSTLTLEELQAQHKINFGVDVPSRYKNDAAWIAAKLENK